MYHLVLQKRNKSQLRISGVKMDLFWLTQFLVDFTQYLFTALICFFILLAFRVSKLNTLRIEGGVGVGVGGWVGGGGVGGGWGVGWGGGGGGGGGGGVGGGGWGGGDNLAAILELTFPNEF